MNRNKNGIVSGFAWKLLERFSVSIVQFVLQVLLARLLDPEHYGVLSIMIIFTTLANVFVQNGFNTALIQNKDVLEEDYSSVLWFSLGIAGGMYVIIFLGAPLIASFYDIPHLVDPLRVLALMLFPGAFNSVQLAKISREMEFRKVFYSNIGGMVISGIIGIAMALMGCGLWALVAQTLLNIVVACIVMRFTVKLKIRLVCNVARVKVLFSFGWKLLVSSLLDTLYQDLRSLVIGKKYDSGTLGYYNRGKQFPQLFINTITNAVQSVMLPAMSSVQDDRLQVKSIMRKSIIMGSYIIFPIMAGLAAVAEPLVRLLLTDKWLPCVPYMQIYCVSLAFYPINSCNLQAMNAMGRSDLFLKLEIIKKVYGIVILVVAVLCFDSPIAIAVTGIISSLIGCFVNAFPNKKLINYSYFEQMKDIIPSMMMSIFMVICVLPISLLNIHALWTLILQVVVGVALYVILSIATKYEPYEWLLDVLKKTVKKAINKA